MPQIIGHETAKQLVANYRNQVNFGGGFDEVKAVFEYAVALERTLEAAGGTDTQREYNAYDNSYGTDSYDDDNECENCDPTPEMSADNAHVKLPARDAEKVYTFEFEDGRSARSVTGRNIRQASDKLDAKFGAGTADGALTITSRALDA